jgi:hypothetical protein
MVQAGEIMEMRAVKGTLTTTVKRSACLMVLCVASFGLVSPADAGGQLYRYRNAEGHAEISNSVPPERAALGYEVLDAYSMRVVKVIEPQKSPEEVARMQREERARMACQSALDRVNRLYQSELDVNAAKEQTIRSLLTRIDNAKMNLARAQKQNRELEAEAARQERSGRTLDAGLRDNIDRAHQQITTLEAEIAQRYGEQDAAERQYAEDLKLFVQGTCEDERAMRFLQAQATE